MKKSLVCLLLLALLALGAPATLAQDAETLQPPDCETDLSGETLRFYHFGPLSGVFAQLTQPVLLGFEDALAYYNERGGLCGGTLEMEYTDTGGDQSAAQAAWDDFTNRGDAAIMFVYLTEDAELLRDQAAQQEIPLVVSSGSVRALYGNDADEPGWVFSVTPLYPDQTGAFCDYIAANWDDFGIEGDPVMGHVSILGALGESSDTPETRAYCESVGVGYAGARYFLPGIPDLTTQVQGVVDEGANIIYTTSIAGGPAQIAATVQALGLQDQVIIGGPNIVLDTSTITQGGGNVDGMLGHLPYLWWDEISHPGIQAITQYWAENRLPAAENPADAFAARNVAYLVAWAAVDLYIRLAAETIDRVGFENFDGAAMFETMTSGTRYEALEGVIFVEYTEDLRHPRESRIGQIQIEETDDAGLRAQIVPLTDWLAVPDLRPSGADVPED
ncbi:MAG: ABC transporter substrate-binding protein [Anaerolineales bacterium]